MTWTPEFEARVRERIDEELQELERTEERLLARETRPLPVAEHPTQERLYVGRTVTMETEITS